MIDREKVIKGLECCIVQSEEVPPLCEECPYCDEKIGSCEYFRDILSDALALLKEQEPRMMTVEEIKKYPAESFFVWMERSYQEGIDETGLVPCEITGIGTKGITHYYGNADFAAYNKRTYGWRCWTARPTDEQRKATPWKE